MAPSSDPKITLLVSIDEPDPYNYYAAQTAAPTAKQLFADIFNYLAIKGDSTASSTAQSIDAGIVSTEKGD
jgi:stage V sporulation protein D (sporulation-specific penicillin-binding protein)